MRRITPFKSIGIRSYSAPIYLNIGMIHIPDNIYIQVRDEIDTPICDLISEYTVEIQATIPRGFRKI